MYINDIGAWFQGTIPTIIILGSVGSILAALILKLVGRARGRRRYAASIDEAGKQVRVEKQFREAERQLDELLHRDKAMLVANGITITDWSSRAYNYKTESLSWSYWFETRRARGSEVEKVLVSVSLDEADPRVLRVGRLADIFQIGQRSRWQSHTEELLPLEDAIRIGLSSIVTEAIRAGKAAAAEVA